MLHPTIKSPNIFRAILPSAEAALEGLANLPLVEMEEGSSMLRTYGFVPNAETGELITAFSGGYSFHLRYDEKKIPPAEVRKEQKRREKIQADRGFTLGKADKAAMKEDVILFLATKAFTSTTIVDGYYHAESELLFITGSRRLAGITLAQLIKCLGTVTTTTIHIDGIKRGLTECLKSYKAHAENGEGGMEQALSAFGHFDVSSKIALQDAETGVTMTIGGLDAHENAELDSALERGFQVTSIELYDRTGIEFTLSSDFRITGIKWPPVPHEDDADNALIWRHEASVQALILSTIVNRLCDVLGKHEEAKAA